MNVNIIVVIKTVSPTQLKVLRNLYSSLNIIRMSKSRRRGWAGHVARIGKRNGGIARRKEITRKTKT
jgi:hypothetical protein